MCKEAVTDLIGEKHGPARQPAQGQAARGHRFAVTPVQPRACLQLLALSSSGTGVALQGVVTCQTSVVNGSPMPSQGLDAQRWVCLLRTERWVGPKPEHRPGELPELAPCPRELVTHLYPPPCEPLTLSLLSLLLLRGPCPQRPSPQGDEPKLPSYHPSSPTYQIVPSVSSVRD